MNDEQALIERFLLESLCFLCRRNDISLETQLESVGIDSLALFSLLSYAEATHRLTLEEKDLLAFTKAESVADLISPLLEAMKRGTTQSAA